MIVLGLNAYHGDSSACLVIDGRLVAAAEEERFRRIKHWAGFPSEAVRYCLRQAGLGPGDIDHVAVNRNPRANLWRKLARVLTHPPRPAALSDRWRNASRILSLPEVLACSLGTEPSALRAAWHRVEHHRAHLASAYRVSPFDEAAVVSVDGFGDFASAMWGRASGGAIRVDGTVRFPHSLGLFYLALTQYLGFPHYGDEYKVMGLAAYGKPAYLPQMRKVVRLAAGGQFRLELPYFRHHAEGVSMVWDDGQPSVGRVFSERLERLLGPARAAEAPIEQRHRDLAASLQAMYEEAFFHLLAHVHARSGSDALALAGGCAMNSVANGKIYARSPFRRLYVQAAAGDAGGAIGAAFEVHARLGGSAERFRMEHAYWGPEHGDDEIGRLIDSTRAGWPSDCRVLREQDDARLCERTARLIAGGGVVGWFQGRMEWGPRALGNRSILGDPRRADMKDILNLKIKRRESFRPFAPSVLREEAAEWFTVDDDVPFMLQVYPIRPEKRPLIPAVTHVDGTGRLQTVTASQNPLYHRLIRAFADQTGVPMLLNTSFNENEPIVCAPREALECFLRTRMDALVMGRWVLEREAEK